MSDMKALMELMNAFNQGGPGNQFSQTYNPAAQYGPRSSPMPSPQGVGTPPGVQTDNKMLEMLNPRMFGPGEQGSAPHRQPCDISTFSGKMGSPGGSKKIIPMYKPQGMGSEGGAK
jgi:hypothetical protein